jgi:spore maturation protein CgeB
MAIFGLTVSSSWGNGHATLWRGLIRALADCGWTIEFFERDVPYYAATRDLTEIPRGELILYPDWQSIQSRAQAAIAAADVAVVTSFCPDGPSATKLIAGRRGPLRVFYDLDTPVTLAMLKRGDRPSAIGDSGLADFDLVLSYTGGGVLDALRTELGARHVAPLYGHVDPAFFRPGVIIEHCRADLSYIGTYAADRQDKLDALLVAPAH